MSIFSKMFMKRKSLQPDFLSFAFTKIYVQMAADYYHVDFNIQMTCTTVFWNQESYRFSFPRLLVSVWSFSCSRFPLNKKRMESEVSVALHWTIYAF